MSYHPPIEERIINSALLCGFFCTELAWHQTVYNKAVLTDWRTFMYVAGVFWVIGFATLYWYRRAAILQEDIPGVPPWYFFLLGVPMCIYASVAPWFLLAAFTVIQSPAIAI